MQDLAELVVAKGTDAVAELADELDDLKIAKKENIEVGTVVRFEAADGNILDSYLHLQDGRGVNAVLDRARRRRPRSWPTTSPCTSPSPSRPT